MANKLIQLPKFSYTALDFDTIINDVQNLIKEHPEYNTNWDDFLESNAGRMLIEVVAYVIEKGASKVDWTAREMFVSTATRRQSLINILKLINYRPQLPKSAKVGLKLKLTKWMNSFTLSAGEKITAVSSTGNPITFELLSLADDGKPNYEYTYTLNTGTRENPTVEFYNVPFYQGKTIVEDDIYSDGVDNEKFVLTSFPVIENSIRVYSLTKNIESKEVDSFISVEAQQEHVPENQQAPPYLIEIDELNKATIVFGPNSLVQIPIKGERFKITYRVGGGENGNIVAGAVNQTKTYTVGDQRASILYSNPSPGSGGSNEENIDAAKLTAPISLRSANKTVTREDYIQHLEKDATIMHANVVGKENEPDDIYSEYGYFLPPLDTWIYITPNRAGWENMDPYILNQRMLITRPYTKNDFIGEEEIQISTLNQTAFLKNYNKYKGFAMYVTLHEESTECVDYLAADSYIEGIDYTVDSVNSTLTRISTADDGTIPSGTRTLKIRYIYNTVFNTDGNIDQANSVLQFKNATVKTFQSSGTDEIITLASNPNNIFPNYPIKITNITGDTEYILDEDYTINWVNNIITKTNTSSIGSLEKVIVTYASNWTQNEDNVTEEKMTLEIISDKKMICVDNYVKDSIFTPFDVKATIYCYKNMRGKVQQELENYIREFYTLDKMEYNSVVHKMEISNNIMQYPGVRFLEIEYLGRDYNVYRKYILDEISLEELQELKAENMEYKIDAKYNEILLLSNDMYDGSNIVENKRHGLIFTYKEA